MCPRRGLLVDLDKSTKKFDNDKLSPHDYLIEQNSWPTQSATDREFEKWNEGRKEVVMRIVFQKLRLFQNITYTLDIKSVSPTR